MEDFTYKGATAYYLPHPKLFGRWEVYIKEILIGRFHTKKECKKAIHNA